jgi:hypothetical protein
MPTSKMKPGEKFRKLYCDDCGAEVDPDSYPMEGSQNSSDWNLRQAQEYRELKKRFREKT